MEVVVVFQELVQKSIDETAKAVHIVNELDLFATNEDIEEIATSDLRFLLKLVSAVIDLAISPSQHLVNCPKQFFLHSLAYVLGWGHSVRNLSTSAVICPKRLVSKMTCYVFKTF